MNAPHAFHPQAESRSSVARFLELIRFSHTVFALPFALGALLVATNGRPSARLFLLVLLCMIFARTAAMLFNRIVDWSLDQRNPRTAARHTLAATRDCGGSADRELVRIHGGGGGD